jgi:hypothetical protein
VVEWWSDVAEPMMVEAPELPRSFNAEFESGGTENVLRRLIRRAVSQHVPTSPGQGSDPLYPEATHRESTVLLLSIPNGVSEIAGTRLGGRIRVAELCLTTPSKSPRRSTGRWGASPPYGVVKLPSVF